MMIVIQYLHNFQSNVEKQNKILHGDIVDKTQRLDEQQTSIAEADINHKKLSVEKSDLEKSIDEADKTLRALSKLKASLSTQVQSLVHITFGFIPQSSKNRGKQCLRLGPNQMNPIYYEKFSLYPLKMALVPSPKV